MAAREAGVMHATADALARAPLRWSAPTLVLTGDTAATGCIDELAETCQFDGKLAVVRFKGRVWLYAAPTCCATVGRGTCSARADR